MKRWEYRVEGTEIVCSPDRLDVLGDNGWELVAVVLGTGGGVRGYFKREAMVYD